MTPAEFDTRRRALGLSVEEVAALCDVQHRRVSRWIAGSAELPDDAIDALEKLELVMEGAVTQMVRMATNAVATGTAPLLRYRTAEDLANSPEGGYLPLGAHAMMIAWTADALAAEGIDCEIEWAEVA